jgi:hypothetical protein
MPVNDSFYEAAIRDPKIMKIITDTLGWLTNNPCIININDEVFIVDTSSSTYFNDNKKCGNEVLRRIFLVENIKQTNHFKSHYKNSKYECNQDLIIKNPKNNIRIRCNSKHVTLNGPVVDTKMSEQVFVNGQKINF